MTRLLHKLPKGALVAAVVFLAGAYWKDHNELVAVRERQHNNEAAAEVDRQYQGWLQWKIDQARVAAGLNESGTPPTPKK